MNRTTLFFSAAALMAGSAFTGCVIRPPSATVRVQHSEPTPPPPPRAGATVSVSTSSQPTVSSGVTVVETTCQANAAEVCNGLDDNCDGQIDEGCGYSAGSIQITLAWNTEADLDLYVANPQNETLYYGAANDSYGGHLDHDARGACQPGVNNNIENVYWDANPPQGTYQVVVKYWDGARCSTESGTTTLTLSIAIDGQVRGAWNYTLEPGQEVQMATFQI